MTQFDVFLSHSSVNKPWVSRLKDDLLRYGVSVWLDQDEIRPGDLFAEALEQALDNCRSVALIVSPEAVASGWVKEEYYRALSLSQDKQVRLQLIPVLLQDAQLPGFLQNRSWIDFRDETAYNKNVWRLVWGITGQKPDKVLDLKPPDSVSTTPVQLASPPIQESAKKTDKKPSEPGPDFSGRLRDILLAIDALREYDNRSMLLENLPEGPAGFINRSSAMATDIHHIVKAAKSWGRLNSGRYALVVVAENALRFFAKGTKPGHDLETLLAEI